MRAVTRGAALAVTRGPALAVTRGAARNPPSAARPSRAGVQAARQDRREESWWGLRLPCGGRRDSDRDWVSSKGLVDGRGVCLLAKGAGNAAACGPGPDVRARSRREGGRPGARGSGGSGG